MGQKTRKSHIFCMISTTLTKNGGGGAECFILWQNFASKFLEN